MVIKKGTKIVCPLCKKTIGEFTKDVADWEVLGSDNMVIYNKKIKNGDPMICPYCGFPYCVEIKMGGRIGAVIYTDKGWLPSVFHGLIMVDLIRFLYAKGLWKKEWDNYLKDR